VWLLRAPATNTWQLEIRYRGAQANSPAYNAAAVKAGSGISF